MPAAASCPATPERDRLLAVLWLWRLARGDWRPLRGLGAGPLPDTASLADPPADWPDALRRLLARRAPDSAEGRAARQAAVGDLDWLERHAARPLQPDTSGCPPLLRQIHDPPAVLWQQGRAAPAELPHVAIVGSRRATRLGRDVAHGLAAGLAAAGVVVVSGMAAGIDAAAHRGALAAGGWTTAVLGGGFGRLYPARHARLAAQIRARGGLLSEFPPQVPPLPHHFPMRNRLISGLCQAVVVVEASERSGTLVTARLALEQDRDLLVVPGAVNNPVAVGCNRLLREGAQPVTGPAELLEALGLADPSAQPPAAAPPQHPLAQLLADAGGSGTVDTLVLRSGWPTARVLAELSALEVAGIVRAGDRGYSLRPPQPAQAGSMPDNR